MIHITSANVYESKLHQFYVEASELGIAPGVTPPTQLTTSLGNKLPFIMKSSDENGWKYFQQLGCITLHILND